MHDVGLKLVRFLVVESARFGLGIAFDRRQLARSARADEKLIGCSRQIGEII